MADDLTPKQHRAADLLGRNWTVERVAAEVGVVPKTIQRWKQREDFTAVLRKRRESLLADLPNAKATLEAALSATTKSGEPDWPIRVKAAQLLMTTADPAGAPDPGDTRPTLIYMPPPEGASDDADQG